MSPLFVEGLNLALYGMGTVFAFLTLLTLMTSMMSKIVSKTNKVQGNQSIDSKKFAAISAAVHQHHNK